MSKKLRLIQLMVVGCVCAAKTGRYSDLENSIFTMGCEIRKTCDDEQ